MTIQLLERSIVIPGELPVIFEFFKDPHNLALLTPSWLGFTVRSASDTTVREGTQIDYRIKWLGLPMRWKSVIERYEEGVEFTDRMLAGPYASWVHRHTFRATPAGVVVGDRVEYALPLGPLGDLAHAVMVRRQLEGIFDFRTRVLVERFGRAP
jgi:hypothetical protein